jgi:hypothetical protein
MFVQFWPGQPEQQACAAWQVVPAPLGVPPSDVQQAAAIMSQVPLGRQHASSAAAQVPAREVPPLAAQQPGSTPSSQVPSPRQHACAPLQLPMIVPFNPSQHTSETRTHDSSGMQQDTLLPPSQTYPAGSGMPWP